MGCDSLLEQGKTGTMNNQNPTQPKPRKGTMLSLQEIQQEAATKKAQVFGLGHYIRAAKETKPEHPASTNAKAVLVLKKLFPEYGPADFSDMQIEAALVGVYRAANPSSRVTGLWYFSHNGGSKAVRACILCYASASWCNKYPKTKKAQETEAEDRAHHLDQVREHLFGIYEDRNMPIPAKAAQVVA